MMQSFHVPHKLNLCFLRKLFNASNPKGTTLLQKTHESVRSISAVLY